MPKLPSPVWTVYKTTHVESRKFYFGVHKARNPNDSYLGSGKHIKAAVKRHGRAAFKKEVLHVFDNPNDAYEKEAELADEAHVSRSDTYNLIRGGVYSGEKFGRSGEENSQRGTRWVHKEGRVKKVDATLLDQALKEGWGKGRGPSFKAEMSSIADATPGWGEWGKSLPSPYKGTLWVRKGDMRRRVSPEEARRLLAEGWVEGHRPRKPRPDPKPSPKGEKAPAAKLTWHQVREIRRLHCSGELTRLQDFSDRFGVTRMTVSKILRGITWVE